MIKFNKPFAFGELGPGHPNGSFDYGLWYRFILFKKKRNIHSFIYLFLFRPPAIESRFNLLSYFHAWYQEFAPIRNKNAYALFNNPHVINRDQL